MTPEGAENTPQIAKPTLLEKVKSPKNVVKYIIYRIIYLLTRFYVYCLLFV